MKAFLCQGRQCYCTLHLFPPVLCHDAVEILGPCRPAFDIPRVIVTVLVAQHRGHIVDDSTKAAWEASRNECSMNETPTKGAWRSISHATHACGPFAH